MCLEIVSGLYALYFEQHRLGSRDTKQCGSNYPARQDQSPLGAHAFGFRVPGTKNYFGYEQILRVWTNTSGMKKYFGYAQILRARTNNSGTNKYFETEQTFRVRTNISGMNKYFVNEQTFPVRTNISDTHLLAGLVRAGRVLPCQSVYEKRIKLKPFWQWSLPDKFFNITSQEHAV